MFSIILHEAHNVLNVTACGLGRVSPKPLLFWSSDNQRAALSPDVVDGIFLRSIRVFPSDRWETKHSQIQREKNSLLSVVDRQVATQEFPIQKKNTGPSH